MILVNKERIFVAVFGFCFGEPLDELFYIKGFTLYSNYGQPKIVSLQLQRVSF